MKKFLSAVVCAGLCVSSFSGVAFADTKISATGSSVVYNKSLEDVKAEYIAELQRFIDDYRFQAPKDYAIEGQKLIAEAKSIKQAEEIYSDHLYRSMGMEDSYSFTLYSIKNFFEEVKLEVEYEGTKNRIDKLVAGIEEDLKSGKIDLDDADIERNIDYWLDLVKEYETFYSGYDITYNGFELMKTEVKHEESIELINSLEEELKKIEEDYFDSRIGIDALADFCNSYYEIEEEVGQLEEALNERDALIETLKEIREEMWTCEGVEYIDALIKEIDVKWEPFSTYDYYKRIQSIDAEQILIDDLLLAREYILNFEYDKIVEKHRPSESAQPNPAPAPKEPMVEETSVVEEKPAVEEEIAVAEPKYEANVGGYVVRCYNVALNRAPDQEGYDYWVNLLESGEKRGGEVGLGFIFSEEYTNKNTSNEQFVTDLYTMFFGREADTEGFNYWVGKLNAGEERVSVFAGFVFSEEFANLCQTYGINA